MENDCKAITYTKLYTSVYDKCGWVIQAFGSEEIKQLALIEQRKSLEVNAEIE